MRSGLHKRGKFSSRASGMRSALKLLQARDTTKVEMDVISVSAVLCALVRSSKWEDVLLHRQKLEVCTPISKYQGVLKRASGVPAFPGFVWNSKPL